MSSWRAIPGQTLLQRIVQLLRKAGSLSEYRPGLYLGFFARGDFKLQLGGAFDDSLLEQIVGLLQFGFGLFLFLNQRAERRVLLRQSNGPTEADD